MFSRQAKGHWSYELDARDPRDRRRGVRHDGRGWRMQDAGGWGWGGCLMVFVFLFESADTVSFFLLTGVMGSRSAKFLLENMETRFLSVELGGGIFTRSRV